MAFTTLNGVQLRIPARGDRNWDAVMFSTTWTNIASHNHTGDPLGNQLGAGALLNNAITDAKLRQGAATSIIGRAAGSIGNVADIVASADNQVLRRSAGTLSWGTIPPASLTTLTASRAVVSDGAGLISASTITSTEVGYLTGLTQNITSLVAQADTSPGTFNIGVRLASGTFTVCGADGADLSASNPGYVVIGSQANPGRLVRLTITANQSFNDDAFAGTSDIAGEEFGTKPAVAWSNDRPFFLYAVNRDDTAGNLLFGISPNPTMTRSPSSPLIGWKLAPSATPSDSSIWLFGSSLTASNYTFRPVLRIGGIRMRKAVTTDDWTVQSLTTNDGIRPSNYEGTTFNLSAGEALFTAAGRFFASANSPSWATPANIVSFYKIQTSGYVQFWFDTTNAANCTNGTTSSQLAIGLPIRSLAVTGFANVAPFTGGAINRVAGAASTPTIAFIDTVDPGALAFFLTATGSSFLNNDSLSNIADDLRVVGFLYPAFGNEI
jgi:hypothetical protein